MAPQMPDITTLLKAAQAGDTSAEGRLVERIYAELRDIASRLMRNERGNHTWSTTDLLHEGIGKLLQGDVLADARGRGLLFTAATTAMRRLLVDHARRRDSLRRGGDFERTSLDDVFEDFDRRGLDVVALDELLEGLATSNPRQYGVINLRFFGGLENTEIGEKLGVSLSTVEADLRSARAWLRSRMGSGPTE